MFSNIPNPYALDPPIRCQPEVAKFKFGSAGLACVPCVLVYDLNTMPGKR